MNHLKTYQLFESSLLSLVDDVLRELSDEGFTFVKSEESNNIFGVIIKKMNKSEDDVQTFSYNEVKYQIDRLISYMDDLRFKKSHLSAISSNYIGIDPLISKDSNNIRYVKVEFIKST